MLTKSFDFALPDDLIALRPVEPRDHARLMVVRSDGRFEHRYCHELPQILSEKDILVFNDSRVIPARLSGTRPSRGAGMPSVSVTVTLHRRVSETSFMALVQPARRLKPGDEVGFGEGLIGAVITREGGEIKFRFNRSGAELDKAIAQVGVMPLPPYIAKKRAADAQDMVDYQTVYARHEGSIAAPTAGLHFTEGLIARLNRAGISRADVTLHVGAGTFLPVEADNTEDHVMHAESAILDRDTAEQLNAAHVSGGRIVAVGTTALRAMESAADSEGHIYPFHGETRIFITPGYRFRAVDVLLTNFHLPRSTLYMLVSAFMGLDVMRRAYEEAITERYRFYSYGDACLLIRP